MEDYDEVRINVMSVELAIQRELAYRKKVEMFSKKFYDDSIRHPLPLEVRSLSTQNKNLESSPTSILARSSEMKRSIPSYQLPISGNLKIESNPILHLNPATNSSLSPSGKMKHSVASYQLPLSSTSQNQNIKSNNVMHLNQATTSSLVAPSEHLPLAFPSSWGNKRRRSMKQNSNSLSGSSVTLSSEMTLSNPSNQLALTALSLSGNKKKDPEGVIFCEACQVPCSGTFNYKQHLEGQKHKGKVQLLEMKREIGGESSSMNLRCELCEIWCTCEDALKLHLRGKKHLMKLYQMGDTAKKNEDLYPFSKWIP